jgi:RNA polymerase sigma-70 factor (ECF subfamily)
MPLRPWVYVIARNKCLDYLKRKWALTFSSLADGAAGEWMEERIEDAEPLPQEVVERADLKVALQGVISALPARYRAVVALRYSTDLTFAEIGAVLELPENTVKTHFQRAKGMLRTALRDLI